MKETAELLKTHRFVGGNRQVLQAPRVRVFEPHGHTSDDNSSFEGGMLKKAAHEGIDFFVAANHDHVTYDRTRRRRDKLGLEIEIFPGTEATALPLGDTGEKHVLVFGSDSHDAMVMKRKIGPLMSMFDLVPLAQDNGLLVAIAHPELNIPSISFTEKEIEIMIDANILPPLLEIHNGGAAILDKYEKTLSRLRRLPLPGRLKNLQEMIPLPGSNEKAKRIHQRFEREFVGVVGGSDAHDRNQIGSVLNAIPEGMRPHEAILQQKVAVLERTDLTRYKLMHFFVQLVRGIGMSDFPKDEGEKRALLEDALPKEIVARIYADAGQSPQ